MTQPVQSESVLRFGVFEVDLSTGELRRNGIRLRVQGQPFQVLEMLLERPGELVRNEELQERLWPDVEVDAAAGLREAVFRIRQALEDSAQAPRYIETVPRRGYRFIAAIDRGRSPQPGPAPSPPHAWIRPTGAAAVGAAAIVLAGLSLYSPPEESIPPVRRFRLQPEAGAAFPKISPDGKSVTYYPFSTQFPPGPYPLWIWDLDKLQSSPIEGSFQGRSRAVSPDGKQVAVVLPNEIRLIQLDGFSFRRVCKLTQNTRGLTWTPDGELIVFANGPLYKVPVTSGSPEPLLDDSEWQSILEQAGDQVIPKSAYPYFLPLGAGRRVVVFLVGQGFEHLVFFAYDLDSRETKLLGPGGYFVSYSSGHLVYSHSGQVWARPFSLEDLEFTGEPFLVVDGVGNFGSASLDGTLVYPEAGAPPKQLIWRSRTGDKLGMVGEATAEGCCVNLSPDEHRVSLSEGATETVVYDLRTRARANVSGGLATGYNAWSPDGVRLAFSSMSHGGYSILLKRSDGVGRATAALDNAGPQKKMVTDWFANYILYRTEDSGNRDLGYLELGPDGHWAAHDYVATDFGERAGSFSPNGRFVAYLVQQSSRDAELVVSPFPNANRQWPVAASAVALTGPAARWTRGGSELVYAQPAGQGKLTLVARPILATQPDFIVGEPVELFEASAEIGGWDVTQDGERFLIAEPTGELPRPGIIVVENWYEEFREQQERGR